MSYKFILPFLIILTFGLTSCVKEYTCRCTMTYTGAPGFTKSDYDFTIQDTEKNAIDKCESQSAIYEYNGIKTSEDCAIW